MERRTTWGVVCASLSSGIAIDTFQLIHTLTRAYHFMNVYETGMNVQEMIGIICNRLQ